MCVRCSFFYAKLLDQGQYLHRNVARWTRRVDLFSYARVFVPVHVHGNHWCLGCIHVEAKRIEYYDSLGGHNPTFFQVPPHSPHNHHMAQLLLHPDAARSPL